MSSAFCSLDEAFAGPVMPVKKKKDKEKSHSREGFVPGPLSGSPDASVPSAMGPPTSQSASGSNPEAAVALNDFFPLPGETGDWTKAFTLEGSDMPLPRPDGAVSVAGKSTLWRQIPAPAASTTTGAATSDIHQRLDVLTRQLESLTTTTTTPMQGTAELFLFIAIGLLLLLAIDTLLRCATSIALSKHGLRGGLRGGFRRRWR